MERSYSLFHFLMSRFGTYFGVLLLVVANIYYFQASTLKQDISCVSLLEETKFRIDQAAKSSLIYLQTGKVKELDEYNSHILMLGKNFNELATLLKAAPTFQPKFTQIQQQTRTFFLDLNNKLEKKQGGRFDQERGLASLKDTSSEIVQKISEMTKELRENSSQPLAIAGLTMPKATWYFFLMIFLALSFVITSRQLQEIIVNDYKNDVSNLKIQSILLDGILNSISEALIVTDEKGLITRYNTAAQRIIGNHLKSVSSEEDAKELGFFDIQSLQQLGLAELPFSRALRGEQVDDLEILVHNEGHPNGIYISISSRYLRDIDGSVRGALVVFRDISRRKATEKEWQRARESALETARKKSDFLAAMSHEIRTPMNGVMGMSTLLAETALNEEQRDYVGTIKRSAQALLRLINDILDHSKIEAGKIQINPRPFDLKVLCEDVQELFVPAVKEKNISLDLQFEGRKDWCFIGDAERVRQVLVNLIGNAVKFTEIGGVRVLIEGQKSLNGKAHFKISVKDTGSGFNEEESQFLFQKYFQTKSGMKYGGTGLGLSICHQLIELMGGEIGLKSQPDVGSTFWFSLDFPEATAEQIPATVEHHFAPLFKGNILLAEDQPVNQRVAATYLQKLGLEVDIANNGQIAVDMALRKSYDLIFMDCQMPVMTGYEATKNIREKQINEKTPIVALTAEGTSGERNSCLACGMDDFLTKPLELEKLTEVLYRWLKSEIKVVDSAALEKLKNYVVNNKSLTQALIEDFAATAPEQVASIREALAKKDLEKVAEFAHALKSTSATLGVQGLSELCKKMENLDDVEKGFSLLDQVDDQLKKSLEELKHYLMRTAA
ncbi:MAG: response regulator [Bdellovibrionaceae bacterium]|nr:response regulator [Pseudobdellovibrionaceae bacterium]